MEASWLDNYPRAAAMLQGDDDVLLYAPQSCIGLEAALPDPVAFGREMAERWLEAVAADPTPRPLQVWVVRKVR